MSTKNQILDILRKNDVITSLDYHICHLCLSYAPVTDEKPLNELAFLLAWLCHHVRSGHICININELKTNQIKLYLQPNIFDEIDSKLNLSEINWLNLIKLSHNNLISDGAPLIFNNNRLYFQRMWHEQLVIANYINQHSHHFGHNLIDESTKNMLDELFPLTNNGDTNWQKVAAIIALTSQIAIISGGPGTGKTTTICKILAALINQQTKPLRIISAAPTGKAASRLTESLSNAIKTLPINDEIKKQIPTEATTIHRLLGARCGKSTFTYNENNPLSVDLLLVDEASMIDLHLMAGIMKALPPKAKLIMLGDKDQLSSVEAGSIFGDLCTIFNDEYSSEKAKIIAKSANIIVKSHQKEANFADNICLLKHSYRFNSESGIGHLAKNINAGDAEKSFELLLNSHLTDVTFHEQTTDNLPQIITQCAKNYQLFFDKISANIQDVAQIHHTFNQFRVLCAVRESAFGVVNINQLLEAFFIKNGWINKNADNIWYAGRAVMILKNSAAQGLYNGDIGIALPDPDANNHLRVFFIMANNEVKCFLPFSLPEHETTFAMTIHKSQGSEFDHVALIMPNKMTPLLTRSLLYTGVTRAKKQVTIFSEKDVLTQTIKNKTQRLSGLVDLLIAG